MKKIFLLLMICVTLQNIASAQPPQPPQPPIDDRKQQDNIEALKVAFVSKELDLTPDEAQKFWPVYNQYDKEFKTTSHDNLDVLDRDEKILNIRKKYKDQFSRIVGATRMNKLYGAEGKFHQLLIKTMRSQHKMQMGDRGPNDRRLKPRNNPPIN